METIATTQSLVYSTSKTIGKKTIYVEISLNDECKNGHEDFSITGDLYEANKPKTDRYNICGGCIHDEILKFFPEFKIFVQLHLATWEGVPMFAVANGHYHLKNKTYTPEQFCEEYTLTMPEYNLLSKAGSDQEFAVILWRLGVQNRWKETAVEAIKILEGLTGHVFESKATRGFYNAPENYETLSELYSGEYFSDANVLQRKTDKKNAEIAKKIADLKESHEKQQAKQNQEFEIMLQLVKMGYVDLSGVIFYNHTQTLVLNWTDSTYNYKFTQQDYDKIVNELKRADTVKIEIKL